VIFQAEKREKEEAEKREKEEAEKREKEEAEKRERSRKEREGGKYCGIFLLLIIPYIVLNAVFIE
jgi:hypothetical protein